MNLSVFNNASTRSGSGGGTANSFAHRVERNASTAGTNNPNNALGGNQQGFGRRFGRWRRINRTPLTPYGKNEDNATLADRLLYSATHTSVAQKRNIANLLCMERLYRRLFCKLSSDPATDTLDSSRTTGDLSFIDFKDEKKQLNLETLCLHLEELVNAGYSLMYIFKYMSYLKRKYRRDYPYLRAQNSAFYRTLIDMYEKKRNEHRRIGTDEVYTCDKRVYEKMFERAERLVFSDEYENHALGDERHTNDANDASEKINACDLLATARKRYSLEISNAYLFAYIYVFMFVTGKRLSEIALIDADQIRTLERHEALVVRIPKSKKLGRITLRALDLPTKHRFKQFLARMAFLFSKNASDNPFPSLVPFDQFAKRRTLDRIFGREYERAVREILNNQRPEERLDESNDLLLLRKKPRGLSLHSLRRYRAGVLFEMGNQIENIRECLDHSSVRMTNSYINKHLMRTYRTQKRLEAGGPTI